MQNDTNRTQKMDTDKERRGAELIATRRREDLLEACRRAVECLERFAADARRELDRAAEAEGPDLLNLPGQVLSASAWGAANAASELSSASRIAAEYMNALGALEVLKRGAR